MKSYQNRSKTSRRQKIFEFKSSILENACHMETDLETHSGSKPLPHSYPLLLKNLKERIRSVQLKAALAINTELVML